MNPIDRITELEPKVKAIIEAQDKKGRWITVNDRFKKQIKGRQWNGEWVEKDRISSRVFIDNMNTLCEFLELLKEI